MVVGTDEHETRARWTGIIPALVTPLHPDGSLDAENLERLIDYVTVNAVHGLSVLGSTGEGALLPEHTRSEALKVVRRAVRGRPVIASILSPVPRDALDAARHALDEGVDAVMLTPPFYYSLDQASVVDFYTEAARTLRRPVIIYHIPSFTRVALQPTTVLRLADVPYIVGIKDSSRDLEFHRHIIEGTHGKPFTVFAGAGDTLSANVSWGGAGAIAASANLIPQTLVRLWNALQAGEICEAARMQRRVRAIEEVCRRFPFPVNWKTTLELAGLMPAVPAFPLHRMAPACTEAMRASLKDLGVIS